MTFFLSQTTGGAVGRVLFRLGFVEAQKARTPAIREAQAVEVVQNPRPGRGRETAHRHHAQVLVAQHRRQATDQRGIGQQRVDVERHFGNADAVAARRDGRMQVGQRLAVIKPGDLRHHAIEQVEDAIRFSDEGVQPLAPIHAFGGPVFVQQARGPSTGFLGRQVGQRQVIAALEVVARILEGGAAFFIDQPGQRFGEIGVRVVGGRPALGFDEQRPARTQAAQRVVQARRCGDQLALRRAVEVGATKARRALEAAVLVQDDARCHQSGPGQPVGEQGRSLAVFGEVQHRGVLPTRPAAGGA